MIWDVFKLNTRSWLLHINKFISLHCISLLSMSSVKGAFMLEIGCSSAKLENGILQREKKYMIEQMWLWVDSHLSEPWAHGQQTKKPFF